MTTTQRSSRLHIAAALAAAGACLALLFTLDGSRAIGASARAEGVACTLVPSSTLTSTLGLSQAQILRNYDPTVATSPSVITDCLTGMWTGAPPTSHAAVMQAARSGRAAQVSIQTWAPHNGSPRASEWHRGYASQVAEFKKGGTAFPGVFTSAGMPSKPFRVPRHGHPAVGLTFAPQGDARGLLVAIACWWSDKKESAICLLDEEKKSRPVVKHLDQIAAVAVPKFLG
jgi:hypothetical protein